ncbi:13234_t:CDS:2 [Ambispora leptoticha]|uniref:13234_t:CDS:1 n=1 Tax=Ambispora leptoticha TaxID=144679 RepID=A0A9N9BJH6_9GLOM|nr:13234_t:CDS:2 [Ambispora leptoticha]
MDMLRNIKEARNINEAEVEKHLITYLSEPVLIEAALKILSENGIELGVLMELDAINKSSRILNAESQEELVISFLVKCSVLKFLEELFELKFLKERFSYLKDFEVGFTYFIRLTEKPDISIFKSIWDQYGTIYFKNNQEDSDLGLVIRHKVDKKCFEVLVIQNILESFLCAQNDATLLCAPEDKYFLYYMLTCAYKSTKKRLQVSDEQEESSLTAKKYKQSRKDKK